LERENQLMKMSDELDPTDFDAVIGYYNIGSLDGSVATLQKCFDKLGRYGPRILSRRSVQMAPI
jgi:hypothetical protein